MPNPRPNVLYVILDSANRWFDTLKFGNFQGLKAQSADFCGITPYPASNQARISMLSGLSPFTTGRVDDSDYILANETTVGGNPLLHAALHSAGYWVELHGKVLDTTVPTVGFDVYGDLADDGGLTLPANPGDSDTLWGGPPTGTGQLRDEKNVAAAVANLSGIKTPFAMFVGLHQPGIGQPWTYPASYTMDHTIPALGVTPTNRGTGTIKDVHPEGDYHLNGAGRDDVAAHYARAMHYADDQLGLLLDGLAANHLDGNTIVIVTSAAGFSWGEHNRYAQHALWPLEIEVPLAISVPDLPPQTLLEYESTPVYASTAHLYDTVLSLTGVGAPDDRRQLAGNANYPLQNPFVYSSLVKVDGVTSVEHQATAVRKQRSKELSIVWRDEAEPEFYRQAPEPFAMINRSNDPSRSELEAQITDPDEWNPRLQIDQPETLVTEDSEALLFEDGSRMAIEAEATPDTLLTEDAQTLSFEDGDLIEKE